MRVLERAIQMGREQCMEWMNAGQDELRREGESLRRELQETESRLAMRREEDDQEDPSGEDEKGGKDEREGEREWCW